MQKSQKRKVEFLSEGQKVIGNMFMPNNSTADHSHLLPAIVMVGPMTGVKEQVAGLWAERLANEGGFVTMAFDHRNFGESE